MQSTDLGVKIGSRIRASRMSIGLTQEQLAEKVGVSWSTISSLVSAKYCYVTRKLRLHQNDRCKRFTLF